MKRPTNLNLLTIRFPLTAFVSILHRLSGILLFLLIPSLMWIFERSLQGPEGYLEVHQWFFHPINRFFLWTLLSAFSYHLFMGIRHMMMDVGWGESLIAAQLSAKIIVVLSTLVAISIGVWLW